VGAWKSETIVYARQGETVSVGGFDAKLVSVTEGKGPNYVSEFSRFEISRHGEQLAPMVAERRFYSVRGMQTTEAAIATNLTGDLYLTVGDYNKDRGWVVRAWRHPLTVWMWIGAGMIALGGLVGLFGERRRAVSRGPSMAEAKPVAP
jgi:cytochrome c-type biogenesis protein CcmF